MEFRSLDDIHQKFQIIFDDNIEVKKQNIIISIFNGDESIDKNSYTYNIYGLYYLHVHKDMETSFKYFKLSSDMGNIHAFNNLGMYYFKKKMYSEAILEYSKNINNT